MSQIISQQKTQLRHLVDDENIARRHRFGADPLTDLDRASIQWLSVGIVAAFAALVIVVVLFS
jgi:hypothetical protein